MNHEVEIDGVSWHHGDIGQSPDGELWRAQDAVTASGENSIVFHRFGDKLGVWRPPGPLRKVDLRPNITDYRQLHDLPEHRVVRDAAGAVWCVVKPRSGGPGETWLVPFSDEYAFSVRADGTTGALGDTPPLPITDLGVTSTGGG